MRRYWTALAVMFFPSLCVAQPDPYSASFAAASAIASAIDSNNRHGWEQGTSQKLDEIIGYEKAIIADLQQLRLDVKQIVTEQFAHFVEANLHAALSMTA